MRKKVILVFVIALIVIQFFQPVRNQSGEITDTHIERLYIVPPNIKAILVRSCYDCHSNNTSYPWYSRIQPGAWYMAGHIKEGKEELNLNNFGEYSIRKRRNKFRAMSSQVRDGEMPLFSYTLIHRNAILSKQEKQALMKWFDTMADGLK